MLTLAKTSVMMNPKPQFGMAMTENSVTSLLKAALNMAKGDCASAAEWTGRDTQGRSDHPNDRADLRRGAQLSFLFQPVLSL